MSIKKILFLQNLFTNNEYYFFLPWLATASIAAFNAS